MEVRQLVPTRQAHRPKTGEALRAPNLAATHDAVQTVSAILADVDEDVSPLELAPQFGTFEVSDLSSPGGGGLVFCKSPDDVQPTPQQFTVRIPPRLYDAARGGVTYTYTTVNDRTASDGGTPETQYLQPAYVEGDLLLCIWTGDEWRDLNVDARAWVADP